MLTRKESSPRRTITLAQAFAAACFIIGCALCGSVAAFWQSSERAALAASQRARQAVARGVEGRVAAALGAAVEVLDDVERAFAIGLVAPDDRHALEGLLSAELLGAEHLAEVTFTAARPRELEGAPPGERQPALDVSSDPLLAPGGRFQVSACFGADGTRFSRITEQTASGFVERRFQHLGEGRSSGAPSVEHSASDPTAQPTFVASIAPEQAGEPVWSDLHFAELDHDEPAPRVVLTVQMAVSLPGLVGVVRVGLLTTALDAITQRSLASADAADPHLVELVAVPAAGVGPLRLVTRPAPGDPLVSSDDELRVAPQTPPAALRALLAGPLDIDPDNPAREAELLVAGERWLATLAPLSIAGGGTRGWAVAVLVPRSHYTREVSALGRNLSLAFAACLCLACTVFGAVLVVCRRGLAVLGARTARMRQFDFAPEPASNLLGDVANVLESLERAKTVARAMGKYAPLPLVQALYEQNRDPELGGEPRDVTVLFSDIQGFTALAERLAPDELARRLGQYFTVMIRVLERHGATIDKLIGDAVMALWNAPTPRERHSTLACRAVLACQQELAELYARPEWRGLPPLVTRFGLHRATVLVGHFGAPARLSYTAIGDGVNLAARLENECKRYGLTTLVSASVADEARAEFELRPVDRIVVRGKTAPVDVFELTGPRSSAEHRS